MTELGFTSLRELGYSRSTGRVPEGSPCHERRHPGTRLQTVWDTRAPCGLLPCQSPPGPRHTPAPRGSAGVTPPLGGLGHIMWPSCTSASPSTRGHKRTSSQAWACDEGPPGCWELLQPRPGLVWGPTAPRQAGLECALGRGSSVIIKDPALKVRSRQLGSVCHSQGATTPCCLGRLRGKRLAAG